MLAYIIRRLSQSTLVMAIVALLAFTVVTFVGDPVQQMVGLETSREDMEKLRESLGLNDPIIVQFGRFIGNALQGEFGLSYQHKRPVLDLFAEKFPATIELAFVAAAFALIMGLPMGVYAGLNRTGLISRIFMATSLLGVCLPTFLIGILLIYVFSVTLNWFPSFGRGEIVNIGWWTTGLLTVSGFKSLILPAVTLGTYQLTLIMRLVRSEMLEILRTDYIKFARARGLRNRAIHFRHALKNTMIPVITITGLQIGSVIAFAIITEFVFQWPGMGLMFLHAINSADVPIMSTYLLLVAFMFVVINLIVDTLYYVIDPRLRLS